MKKFNKLMCLLTAGVIAVSLSIPTFAAGENVVTFDGKDMISDFNDASFTGMVPGDEKKVEIVLKNDADFDADWYMRNDILSALAEGRESAGGAFEYEVGYDGKIIYSSDTMVDNETENGIADNVSALNDFVFLDTLKPGAQKTMSLFIKVEGETQTNTYMNSLSSIRASFAATSDEGKTIVKYDTKYVENEIVENDSDEVSDDTTTNETTTTTNAGSVVKTGDAFNLQLYTILFVVAGVVVLALAIFSFYKDRKKEEA